jgi:hypothetical protein
MTKAKTAMFDAGDLDTIAACNRPTEVQILHPITGAPTGLFISVVGKDGDAYRSRVRAMADENLRRGGGRDVTLDKLEAKNIDALVAATVAWRSEGDDGHITLRGERLECTPPNVRRLYTEILPIREQVSEAISDLSLFIKD